MLSSLAQKISLSLTGLFLCLFLVIHLLGNFQLLLPEEEALLQFNSYASFLTGLLPIQLISYGLYLSIIAHAGLSLWTTMQNRKASETYVKDQRSRASKWYSRNMGVLGSIILVFIIIHMKQFWYEYKFGSLPLDANGHLDLYSLVITTYQELWYVVFYVVAMIALCFHLMHGFYSAFRTIGMYHPRYVKLLKPIGIGFSIVMGVGYSIIPIYVYLFIK